MADKWKFHRSVTDGEKLLIEGLNVWEYDWKDTGRYIAVKDPIYGQDHTMCIYEIDTNDRTITFAAGEFSNLVWGIYLQE